MANLGKMMTPDVLRGMAIAGKLGADMGGKGLAANSIADLASNLAAGPTMSSVAGSTPATPAPAPAPAQPAAAGDPRDINKDGIVSPDE